MNKLLSVSITNEWQKSIPSARFTSIAAYNLHTQKGSTGLIPNANSTFNAECLAIIMAIKLHVKDNNHYIILTDSKSVLESLKSVTHKSPSVIIELHKILRSTLKNSLSITLIWVPGHRGISQNEAADRFAKSVNENTENWQIAAVEDLIVVIRKLYNDKKENC
ncbi:hypothetical protein AVEN_186022-1 [Araneus ventricosus]|uniref:RNase H type-1 domain-containing protein n=1 Tax=Araneus ventricosus TaxID=182803 RepID=A0A4Y2JCY9_ARAVE|nr:hypothetical protein AVEN_186022-1 [Araneus ventricosus]